MRTHHIFAIIMVICAESSWAQVSGNINYRSLSNQANYVTAVAYAEPGLHFGPQGDNTFVVKGLFNCTADSYLAIFSITQVGKTQKELTKLMEAKLDTIRWHLLNREIDAEIYVDMISFVPVYEMEVSKKLFSKTYNEIPKGFELKKNLHFTYKDPAVLDELVSICADQEIYDLVRVDYTVENIEEKKDKMIGEALRHLDKKMDRFETLLVDDFSKKQRLAAERFNIHYPTEQYSSYQAYCSNAMNYSSQANAATVVKTTSLFYMPKRNKDYDFVVNPAIHEPVVQIEYEIRLRLYPKPEEPKKVEKVIEEKVIKEIFMITPDAEIKKINF